MLATRPEGERVNRSPSVFYPPNELARRDGPERYLCCRLASTSCDDASVRADRQTVDGVRLGGDTKHETRCLDIPAGEAAVGSAGEHSAVWEVVSSGDRSLAGVQVANEPSGRCLTKLNVPVDFADRNPRPVDQIRRLRVRAGKQAKRSAADCPQPRHVTGVERHDLVLRVDENLVVVRRGYDAQTLLRKLRMQWLPCAAVIPQPQRRIPCG